MTSFFMLGCFHLAFYLGYHERGVLGNYHGITKKETLYTVV